MGTFSAELLGVSDSVIISVPLENKTDNCVPINNTLAVFKGICLIYNISLATHKPIRGGIDIGWGTRLAHKEYICEETGEEVILIKDKEGKVIGFERLNVALELENKGSIPLEAVTV